MATEAQIGLTEEIAGFVESTSLDDVPTAVSAAAKRSILDGLGLAVAGSRSDGSVLAREMVSGYQQANVEATILGTDGRTSARFAAFLNGISIHADDFDDTQLAVAPDRVYGLLTHPTAPVLPASLAVAERTDLSGAALLLGYLIGVEVATKLAEAISPRHYDDGFHSTATLGAIGSAAGAAKLMGLSPAQTRTALAIAASQAGGLRENFGTMTKPFHAGRAAESAIVAVELARTGFTAAPNALEARRGFFQAAGGGFNADGITGKLGNPWTFEYPGISIKPFPCGSLTHPGMCAMLDMVRAENIQASDVKHVTVGTNRHMPNALIHHRPSTELQAKFSMEFCMAILLLERRAGLAQFTDDVVLRPDVQEMVGKVHFGVDPEAEAQGYATMTTIIRVELNDGRVLETRADFGRGSPQHPMSDTELVQKFTDCLNWGGARIDGEAAAKQVLALEDQASTRSLVKPFATEHR